MRLHLLVPALLLSLAACRGTGDGAEPPDALASPQAKAEPAPFANLPAVAGGSGIPFDAGTPPVALRGDREVGPDNVPRDPPKEVVVRDRDAGRDAAREVVLRESKELSGYTLTALLRPVDVPPPYKGPEVSAAGTEAAKKRTEPRLTIDLSATRARIVVTGGGFVLPPETELRARLDRLGHILLWPGESTYRVVAPGALRALLGERRLDVAPFLSADVVPAGEGARRLNLRTRRVDVTTRAAKAHFEIATVKDGGEGGILLCRVLLDLLSAPPATPLCGSDEIPLHVDLRWTSTSSAGGRPTPLAFDVLSLTRRADIQPTQMAAPPANVAFVRAPPPLPPSEALLTRGELAALRTTAIEIPTVLYGDAQAPDVGLALANTTDQLRVAWLDGVPIAWLAPGARTTLPSLVRGRYALQWRTFLGDEMDPEVILVPGTSEISLGDAGAAVVTTGGAK